MHRAVNIMLALQLLASKESLSGLAANLSHASFGNWSSDSTPEKISHMQARAHALQPHDTLFEAYQHSTS